MARRKARTRRASPIYSVERTVRISKKMMLFDKGFEQNWTLEVFRTSKVLRCDRRAVLRRRAHSGEDHEDQVHGG
jgi:hypothetical protein